MIYDLVFYVYELHFDNFKFNCLLISFDNNDAMDL